MVACCLCGCCARLCALQYGLSASRLFRDADATYVATSSARFDASLAVCSRARCSDAKQPRP